MRIALKRTLGFWGSESFGAKVRLLLAGLIFVGLAACDVPSIRTQGDTSALNVQSVKVDASNLAAVEGRPLSVTKSQLEADFTRAISAAFAAQSDPNGRPVQVLVDLEQVRLAPPAERIVAGTSTAVGVVTVTELGTGAVIVPPTRVTGNTENFRGVSVIGLVTTASVDKDYNGTVNGFANAVRAALFGEAG